MKIKKNKIAKLSMMILLIGGLSILCLRTVTRSYDELHPIVAEILNDNLINNCTIKQKSTYDDIHYDIVTPKVTSGEIEQYINSVKEEYQIDEITEEFVKNEFLVNTIEDFYEDIEKKALSQKKVSSVVEARESVIEKLFARFRFYLDEKEISEFSLEIIKAYELEAELHNMSLEEYYKNVLRLSSDDFFSQCYDEGEKIVKTYLVVGKIAQNEFGESGLVDKTQIHQSYQMLENQVYSLFISAESDF